MKRVRNGAVAAVAVAVGAGAAGAALAGCGSGPSRSASTTARSSAAASSTTAAPATAAPATTTRPGGLSSFAGAAAARACATDVNSVETALEAYFGQAGSWPAADDWAALVPRYLPGVPGSHGNYAINFDGQGRVSADRAGVGAYVRADDVDANPSACSANATGYSR